MGCFIERNKEYVMKRSLEPDHKGTICPKVLYLVWFCFILPTVNATNYSLLMVDQVLVPKLTIYPTFLIIIFMKL